MILNIIFFLLFIVIIIAVIISLLSHKSIKESFNNQFIDGEIYYDNISDGEDTYEFVNNYNDVEVEENNNIQYNYNNITESNVNGYCGTQQYPYLSNVNNVNNSI